MAARNNREKELRDKQKEQQAAQRAEAASKRNARSERRRGEGLFPIVVPPVYGDVDFDLDSPPPTPSLSPSKAAQPNGKPKADSPPSARPNSINSRKTGRPPARRGRLGRNQYTRDQTHGEDGETPGRDASHDVNGNHGGSPSGNGGNTINGESGRSSKAKTHPARTSLNEMKRRVAAILEFVGRMQTERVVQTNHSSGNGSAGSSKGANTPNGVKGSSSSNLPTASLVRAVEAGLQDARQAKEKEDEMIISLLDEKDFGTMGSVEMMETLTRELVQWQSVYGIYSR